MTHATTRSGEAVSCERDYDLGALTRRQCRECSLCSYNRNCNGTPVGPNHEFDQFFTGDEADYHVYVLAVPETIDERISDEDARDSVMPQ